MFLESTNGGKVKELFHKKGNQGNDWLHHKIEIDQINSDYVIMFEATIGTPTYSDIAIDHVKFSPECKSGQVDVVTSTEKENPKVAEPSPVLGI